MANIQGPLLRLVVAVNSQVFRQTGLLNTRGFNKRALSGNKGGELALGVCVARCVIPYRGDCIQSCKRPQYIPAHWTMVAGDILRLITQQALDFGPRLWLSPCLMCLTQHRDCLSELITVRALFSDPPPCISPCLVAYIVQITSFEVLLE